MELVHQVNIWCWLFWHIVCSLRFYISFLKVGILIELNYIFYQMAGASNKRMNYLAFHETFPISYAIALYTEI